MQLREMCLILFEKVLGDVVDWLALHNTELKMQGPWDFGGGCGVELPCPQRPTFADI